MQLRSLFLGGCLAGAYAAAPTGTATACAEVRSSVISTSHAAIPTVSGQLGYDCLQSVPLDAKGALDMLDSIFPYVKWQTDVSYLKNPPPSYLSPAVDIWAELYGVYDKVNNSAYAGEYEFEADLFQTFNLAKDGHFRFLPDLLTLAMTFSRNVGLVSVSLNGTDLPQIYVHSDINALVASKAGNFTPSPVTSINGQDAVAFLNDWAQLGVLQDPDAGYNSLFFSKPFAATSSAWQGYFAGSERFGYIWPGNQTEIGFQNGTTRTYPTIARVIGGFNGITDGESMYQRFCTGATRTTNKPAVASASATSTPVPGYPAPVVVSSDHVISGYFLNSTRNSDVAVLSLLNFDADTPAEFQDVLQTFLADAKAAGKTKLVIDLSANGGGYILLAYETFRQLFPQIEQDGFNRFRYTPALAVMAQQYAAVIPADFDPNTASEDMIDMYLMVPNYRYDLNVTDGPFTSVADKIGAHEYNGDNFTSILRWNLNDPLTTTNTTYGLGMEITGYGSRRNFTQPFAAEDIVMLYDGYCGSTCVIFSEFMRVQAGVKSIALGGRPSRGPIQAIGGSKGANNYGFDVMQRMAELTLNSGTTEQQHWDNWTALTQMDLRAFNRAIDTSINVRDNILRDNLADGLPAQFVYEPADCRLFYEPAMMVDVAATWEAAADAAWGSKPCVNGHLGLKKRTLTKRKNLHPARPLQKRTIKRFEPLQKDRFWHYRHGTKVPF
ncbi:hypothetical protein VTN77DRAFT_9268 [Rasamsonia byssochlamydoides]|uniref:uncharacterized protein n=1 Tax=Rasamsonia byssochlamydoides TaxID=89139 RepID=UPI003742CF97